jgi:hypothetical protein
LVSWSITDISTLLGKAGRMACGDMQGQRRSHGNRGQGTPKSGVPAHVQRMQAVLYAVKLGYLRVFRGAVADVLAPFELYSVFMRTLAVAPLSSCIVVGICANPRSVNCAILSVN